MTTPEQILTDDRIAAMRQTVLGEVNRDVQRRRDTRRKRTLAVSAAAAVAVIAVGGSVIAGNQLGGSSSSSPDSSFAEGPAPATGTAAPTVTGTAAPAPGALKSGAGAPGAGGAPLPADTPDPGPSNRQVITTGTVAVTAADPARAARDLVAAVEKAGGRVDSRNETGTDDDKSARLTLRLPPTQVNPTVEQISSLGEVTSVQLDHDDVTSTVVDLEARIRATQLSVDRLTAILAQADTSDKVIQAEGALTQRQQQLESLQSRRASIGEQVGLSTLTVTITGEKPPAARTGFSDGLQGGWNAFTTAGRWLIVAAGAALPWIALLLVLYGGYRVVRRFRPRSDDAD